jgi:hypothetical protein
MKYNFKAIPEATWWAFAAAFSGLAGALCIALGAPEGVTAALTSFIGASFRIIVALIGAVVSSEGTVSTGTGNVESTPIPPSP